MENVEQAPLSATQKINTLWLWPCLISAGYVAGLLLLHPGFAFDQTLANMFFTRPCTLPDARACWMFDKNDRTLTFWLHTMPSDLFRAAGGILFIIFIAGFRSARLKPYRELSLTALISIGATTGIVALLKGQTGHYCPGQWMQYGGAVDPLIGSTKMKALCYPAGHPSPAFGLMAMYFGDIPKRWRVFGLTAGITLGSIYSFIQIARGEHWLSHCMASALTALFVGGMIWSVNKWRQSRRKTA